MKATRSFFVLAAAAVMAFTSLSTAPAGAAEKTFKQYGEIVDFAFVQPYAAIPARKDVLIIDARPTARKFDKGHIPVAASIPDRKFDKMTNLLPQDKGTLLIFYCGGLKCALSHKSAFKAEKLGYTNVKVYAAGYPDWVKNGGLVGVSAAYVKKLIDKKANAVIIDSRPKKRKYDKGHVPTSISIADRKFDTMIDQLPTDKKAELIFYCGGLKCKLSPNSANKAKKLGYTNVKVFQGGYPAWVAAYGKGDTAAATKKAPSSSAAIEVGEEEGMITFASFENIVANAPASIHLIDVRDAEEVAAGTFKTAKNITVDDVEATVADLPSDKPIVFVCATGARSGEAYDIVKSAREELKVYFLNAEVAFGADGSFELKPAS
jgi:rhodanese-related sulfurtransferase